MGKLIPINEAEIIDHGRVKIGKWRFLFSHITIRFADKSILTLPVLRMGDEQAEKISRLLPSYEEDMLFGLTTKESVK